MSFWNEYLRMLVDGAALSNTTTPTSLLHAGVKKPVPAGFFAWIGQGFRVRGAGRISTVVTTPGTLTLDLKFGSIIIASTGAMVLSTTAKTTVPMEFDIEGTVRALGGGTAANLMLAGTIRSEALGATTVAGEQKVMPFPSGTPAVSNGFDDTAAASFDLVGTWSVANASNSITIHQFSVSADPGL